MSHLIRAIVQNYIENSNCFDIVAKDGITTDQFAIYKSDLLFVKASLNVRQVQLQIPAIPRSISIARNLDYYQNKICHEIPSIRDTEKVKLILQKLRVIIITLFLRLNRLMVKIKSDHSISYNNYYLEWNMHSEEVLIVTSTLLVDYQQGRTETKILDSIKKTLEYLGISMSMLDDEISYLC
ncbi:MAG TPA: hypothetical protein VIP29_00025 [Nitrososphaeraceae archaeon]